MFISGANRLDAYCLRHLCKVKLTYLNSWSLSPGLLVYAVYVSDLEKINSGMVHEMTNQTGLWYGDELQT